MKSKKVNFHDLAKEVSVNYEGGEATLKVIEFVEKNTEKIGEKHDIYKGKVVLLGSSANNVRLGAPDEADFNLVLNWENVSTKLKDINEIEHAQKWEKWLYSKQNQNQSNTFLRGIRIRK